MSMNMRFGVSKTVVVVGVLAVVAASFVFYLLFFGKTALLRIMSDNTNGFNLDMNAPRLNYTNNSVIRRIYDLNNKPVDYGFMFHKGIGLDVSGIIVKDGIQSSDGKIYISIVVPTDRGNFFLNVGFKGQGGKVLVLKLGNTSQIPNDYSLSAVDFNTLSGGIIKNDQIVVSISMTEDDYNLFSSKLSYTDVYFVQPVTQVIMIGR